MQTKRVVSRLNGGLGNQMFQYAFGRTLAARMNARFFIETGMLENDRLRSYALSGLFQLVARDGMVDLDIACFPVRQIGAKGARTIVPTVLAQNKMPVSHQGMVFASRFVQQNEYQISYRIAGDFDLYLRAGRVGVFADPPCGPLVAVEVEGVASTNPIKAYSEYLTIACKRLRGRSRAAAILLIVIRALCVIPAKKLLPKRWIAAIRGV